jgi:hypothetical protein
MADLMIRGARPGVRRAVAVGAVLAGLLLIGGGGTLVGAQAPEFRQSRVPLVGRTTAVCTVVPPAEGQLSTTEVSAVTIRQAPGREGRLTTTSLDAEEAQATITEQGKGKALSAQTTSVVVAGEGVMATAGSAATLSVATEGVDAGLMAAPCLAPGTSHWFSGVAATEDDRTELILTNADDAQAQVDLRFYGRNGRVVVPGSPGLVVEARSTRTVSLTSLVRTDGPLGLLVQSSQGRVSAVARRSRSDGRTPVGADWQVPASAPATTVVIPGVPEGAGSRQLVVTNPTEERATVGVQVLGLQGPYAPIEAELLDLAPESTGTLELAAGLAGESGTVKLTSDQPVTGAVISTSERDPAKPDLAVQSAAGPLVRTGVSALATTRAGDSELILSNSGPAEAQVSFEVLSYEGVTLRTDDVFLGPDGTATRRLTSPAPSYLVVRVPDGSSVVGTVVLTKPEGDIAGLSTIPLVSPDVASRAPQTRPDPAVAR